jgi:hypothetical protein
MCSAGEDSGVVVTVSIALEISVNSTVSGSNLYVIVGSGGVTVRDSLMVPEYP